MTDVAFASDRAHREAVATSVQDIAKILQDSLGQKLIAHMLGLNDPNTIGKWAAGETEPRTANEDRLRAVFQIFQLLLEAESKHTIRAWFVGLNPQLSDNSPAAAIAEGDVKDVMIAAKAFLSGG